MRSKSISLWFTCPTAMLLSAVFHLGLSSNSVAQTTWTGSEGANWSSANWSAGEPTSSVDAILNNGNTVLIDQAGEACKKLTLGISAAGKIQMTGGSLTFSSSNNIPSIDAYIGSSANGTFVQSGGTVTAPDSIAVGFNALASGIFTLSGTGKINANALDIGYYGSGTFSQNSASRTVSLSGGFTLGTNNGATGTYNLNAGTLTAAHYECIGMSGSGVFNQSAGSNTVSNYLSLGNTSYGSGTYTLSGTGSLSATKEYIGKENAVALFEQSGGSNSATFLSIGAKGRYLLTGGTLQINGGLKNLGTLDFANTASQARFANAAIIDFSKGTIANAASTSLTVGTNSLVIVADGLDPGSIFKSYTNNGLTHVSGTTLNLVAGQSFGGAGEIDDFVECGGNITAVSGTWGSFIHLKAGLSVSGNGNVNLGASGALYADGNTSKISGGTLKMSYLYLGNTPNASSTYSLSGSGKLTTYGVEIGNYQSSGTFNQTSGTHTTTWLDVGAGGNGTYNLSGGSLSADTELVGFNWGGSSTFNQTGGTNTIATALKIGDYGGSDATFNLNGGTLVLHDIYMFQPKAAFNFGGGTLQANATFTTAANITLTGGVATINTAGYSVTMSSALTGSGELKKTGSNILTLAASNTYSGPTTITAGTLSLGSSGSLNSSSIVVQSGAIYDVSAISNGYHIKSSQTLAGAGVVKGSVTVEANGHLSPGNIRGSIATLTFLSNLSLSTGTLFDFDLGLPSFSDKMILSTATLSLSNQQFSDFSFTPQTGFGPGTYTLISANSIQGSLGSKTSGNINGLNASLSVRGGVLRLTVIPEPSTLILLGMGSIGLIVWTWRRTH